MYALSNVGKNEILDAIGEDSIKIVKGNRRSVKIFGIKESLKVDENHEDNEEKPTEFSRKDERTGSLLQIPCFYWIESGGCGKDLFYIRKSYKSFVSRNLQTDDETEVIYETTDPEQDGYERILYGNEGVNIQPEQYTYLGEYLQPGTNSQTGNETEEEYSNPYFHSPDLYPLGVAIESIDKDQEYPISTLKLNDWKQDKLRQLQFNESVNPVERDSEWLENNIEDDESGDQVDQDSPDQEDDQNEGQEAFLESQTTHLAQVDPYCKEFMEYLSFFHLVLRLTGRWPFIETIKGSLILFQINKKSISHVAFTVTSILHGLVTVVSIINTSVFINREVQTGLPAKVAVLEFDKYWHFTFWTYLTAIFVFSWNIFMLTEYKLVFQSFLNRWNLAILDLRYDPKLLVPSKLIYFWTYGFIFYAFICIVGTFTSWLPFIRGFNGVLGAMLIVHFESLRFTKHFYMVRLFGLVYHLYSVWSLKSAMLLLVVYAKILENASKNWILRFAIRFDILNKKYPDRNYGFSKSTIIKMNASYTKLYSELTTIMAFARYTRVIYNVILSIYMLTKGTEIILFIYRSFYYVVSPEPKLEAPIKEVEIGLSGDKLVYRDSLPQQIFSSFAIGFMVLIDWFITSLNICSFGDTILSSLSVVRRHNIIFCENAKERRFIQSIYAQFTAVSEYFPKATFVLNRRLIFRFFIWIALFGLGLLSFTPFLLLKNPIKVCQAPNQDGEVFCEVSYIKAHRRASKPFIKPTTTTTTSRTTVESCEPSWTLETPPRSRNYLITYTSPHVAPELPIFCLMRNKSAKINRFENGTCIKADENIITYNGESSLVYCQNNKMHVDEENDDCGNRAPIGFKSKEYVPLIIHADTGSGMKTKRICSQCFNHTKIYTNRNSLRYCHTISSLHAMKKCNKGRNILEHASDDVNRIICTPQEHPDFTIKCKVEKSWWNSNKADSTNEMPISLRFKTCVVQPKSCYSPTYVNCKPYQKRSFSPYAGLVDGNLTELSCFNHAKPIHVNGTYPFQWFFHKDLIDKLRPEYKNSKYGPGIMSCNLGTFNNGGINFGRVQKRDDCQNLPFADSLNMKAIVLMHSIPPKYSIVCCWDYEHIKENDDSLRLCHMESEDQFHRTCNTHGRDFSDKQKALDEAKKTRCN